MYPVQPVTPIASLIHRCPSFPGQLAVVGEPDPPDSGTIHYAPDSPLRSSAGASDDPAYPILAVVDRRMPRTR